MSRRAGADDRWIRAAWMVGLMLWVAVTVVRPAASIMLGFWVEEFRPFELMEAYRKVLATGFLGVALWSLAAALYLRGRYPTNSGTG
jgi:hypothetical protein